MDGPFRRWPTGLTKNWSEDRYKAYEELQLFLAQRAAGDLEIQRFELLAASQAYLTAKPAYAVSSLYDWMSAPFHSRL